MEPCLPFKDARGDVPEIDDSVIAARLAADDPTALELLWDAYSERVLSTALNALGDRGSALEVRQEVFNDLWDRRAKYDAARGSLDAWVMTIARSHTIDTLRSRRPTADTEELALAAVEPPAEAEAAAATDAPEPEAVPAAVSGATAARAETRIDESTERPSAEEQPTPDAVPKPSTAAETVRVAEEERREAEADGAEVAEERRAETKPPSGSADEVAPEGGGPAAQDGGKEAPAAVAAPRPRPAPAPPPPDALGSAPATSPDAPAAIPVPYERRPRALRRRRRRRRIAFVLGLVAVAGIAVAAALIASGGDEAPAGPSLVLEPPAGSPGSGAAGTATLGSAGGTVAVELTGLARNEDGEFYAVWLLSAPDDVLPLGAARADSEGSVSIALPLPVEAGAYRYLDVSLEADDGDPSHSGRTVLRAPIPPR